MALLYLFIAYHMKKVMNDENDSRRRNFNIFYFSNVPTIIFLGNK